VKPNAGKLLIVGMLAAGVLAAGLNWWFRYAATHRADQFWGADAATLIRDAPRVEALTLEPGDGTMSADTVPMGRAAWRIVRSQDISHARGLTHLRNALLEDRSFDWPARPLPDDVSWTRGLRFRDGPLPPLVILFSPDDSLAAKQQTGEAGSLVVSCAPIAAGLREVLAEWTASADDRR
jgi:hypothetical protein